MFKKKSVIMAGLLTIAVSLMTGVSYAWFTVRADTDGSVVEAGFIQVELTGDIGDEITLYPDDGIYTIDYTVTNKSEITVFAKFIPGELTMHLLPDKYLDEGFVIKEFREILLAMTLGEKKDQFKKTNGINENEVYYGTTGNENDGWTMSQNSEYLGPGDNGESYFRLAAGGTAECSFMVGLTPGADNKYQYSVFTIGRAEAHATQDNDAAIKLLIGDE